MRLREQKQILEESLESIKVKFDTDKHPRSSEVLNRRLMELRNELIELGSKVNFIKTADLVEYIDQFAIDRGDDLSLLNEKIRVVREQIEAVILAIEGVLPDQDPNSVSIKLPDYNNFDISKVSSFIKDIEIILNQTLIDKYKSTIKFQNFDTGTSWIEIILENKEAIVLFGGLIAATVKFIQSSVLRAQETQKYIEKLDIENGVRQTVAKAIEEHKKMQAQVHSTIFMQNNNISEKLLEYHTNLTHSIEKLAGFILKGTEVHPALNAPEEAKKNFPNVKETQTLIENATKLISGRSSAEDQTDGSSEDNQ